MAVKIIPPKREEQLTPKGVPTRRFIEYLEQNAEQTNDSTDATEADQASVNLSNAQLAAINKRVDAILEENSISDSAIIAKLNKRIGQLENTILSINNNSLSKQVNELNNDLVAPFYKTKYEKLTIRTATINKVKLPIDNDATDPTVQFGVNTGFYGEAANILAVAVAGVKRFTYRTTDFRAEAAGGAAIRFISPTATAPGFTPNVGDADTGIGWAGANLLALIAGGVEGLRVSATAITVPTGTWDNTGIDINTGDVYKINGATVLSNDTLGSGVTSSSLTSVGTLGSLGVTGNINTSDVYSVDGTQVVSNQGAVVTDADGTLGSATSQLNALLARVRAHGLIA